MRFIKPWKKDQTAEVVREKIKWIFALFLVLGVIYGSYTLSQYVAENQVQGEKLVVVIDVGHGGEDPGKVGINEVLEKDINLEIALKLESWLKSNKITVALTRTTDEGLESEGAMNKKVEDMKERVKFINELKPQIAVSIHQNSYSSEEVKGAQVFYYTHSTQGEEMAKIMQEAIRGIDPENNRQAKANDTYYLLKHTEVPTIIVECGFLSNREEAEKLTKEEYQEQMVEAIGEGILECLGQGIKEER